MKAQTMTVSALASALMLAGYAHAGSQPLDTQSTEKQGSSASSSATAGDKMSQPKQRESDVQQARGDDAPAADLSQVSQQQITELQQALKERGLYQGMIDGIAGPQTRSALEQFQTQHGLHVQGSMNTATANALGLDWQRQPVRGIDSGLDTPGSISSDSGSYDQSINLSSLSPGDLRGLQQRLKDAGHYQGEIDGVMGPQTKSAVQQFFLSQAALAEQGRLSAVVVEILAQSSAMNASSGSSNGASTRTSSGASKTSGTATAPNPQSPAGTNVPQPTRPSPERPIEEKSETIPEMME